MVLVVVREPAGQRDLSTPGIRDRITETLTGRKEQLVGWPVSPQSGGCPGEQLAGAPARRVEARRRPEPAAVGAGRKVARHRARVGT